MHATGGATGIAAKSRRQVGPYSLITALDDPHTKVPVPERRYVAPTFDGQHTVLLSLPQPGRDPQSFLAEAEASRYLLGPCAAPATAVAVHGGPLPERSVRALGVVGQREVVGAPVAKADLGASQAVLVRRATPKGRSVRPGTPPGSPSEAPRAGPPRANSTAHRRSSGAMRHRSVTEHKRGRTQA